MADRTPKAGGLWRGRMIVVAISLGTVALGWAIFTAGGIGTGFWDVVVGLPLVALVIWVTFFRRDGTVPDHSEDAGS